MLCGLPREEWIISSLPSLPDQMWSFVVLPVKFLSMDLIDAFKKLYVFDITAYWEQKQILKKQQQNIKI